MIALHLYSPFSLCLRPGDGLTQKKAIVFKT